MFEKGVRREFFTLVFHQEPRKPPKIEILKPFRKRHHIRRGIQSVSCWAPPPPPLSYPARDSINCLAPPPSS
jgi:hypothetical protein